MLTATFGFEKLLYPQALLLLPIIILLFWVEVSAKPYPRVRLSTAEMLTRIPKGRRTQMRFLPPIFRCFGLSLLVMALARPLGDVRPRIRESDAIDVMLCVDVSGSMRAVDFVENGKPRDRLYVTKLAVKDFIASRKFRPEDRYGLDRLGLVLYAGYAWTQCPLTFDYGLLEKELEQTEIDFQNPAKDGTAIGSAIGLALSRLNKSEAKTRIIVLLTDGRNNRGELDPVTAAQIAKECGVKIYTIGAGTKDEVLVPVDTPFGEQYRRYLIPIDEELLKRIASETGGKYFNAQDTEGLIQAYQEINQLEKTRLEAGVDWQYEERFFPWAIFGTLTLVSGLLAKRTWFEVLP